MKIQLFTDGACSGNPGKGGFAYILQYGNHIKKHSEGFRRTTNNRMELMAVICGLEALTKEQLDVEVITDSKYVADSIEKKWVLGWEKAEFKKRKNADLWRRFLLQYRRHRIRMHWIKGHAGHPMNEECDEMAVRAYHATGLPADKGFEDELILFK